MDFIKIKTLIHNQGQYIYIMTYEEEICSFHHFHLFLIIKQQKWLFFFVLKEKQLKNCIYRYEICHICVLKV